MACAAPAQAAELDLETLDGPTAVKLMDEGKLTSVELTRAYIARIAALNKSGPGLNAVTQLNEDALKDAALLDKERRDGHVRGPAHGLPILLKDLIDVKGMYTSAGNFSLRNSFPAIDSGVAKKLRENGVVILGKLGLSEYANYFGNQPSGFTQPHRPGAQRASTPTRTRPAPRRAPARPSAAALSMLVVGTETSGSIISPSQANGLVGLRPTVGLVPGLRHRADLGLAGHGRPDGPHGRQRGDDAAVDRGLRRPQRRLLHAASGARASTTRTSSRRSRRTVPNYMSALDLNFVRGKRIGWNGTLTDGTPLKQAYDALVAAGAIMVERPVIIAGRHARRSVLNYEAHRDIDHYYAPPRARTRRSRSLAAGDRRQPGQRARGAEVRQRHARRRAGDRHQPGLGGLDRLPQQPAAWASSSATPGSTG